MSYPGQPYSESGTGEVLKGQVQPLLVELEVGLQGLLDRRPHQLRHVTVSRHSQVFVRQFTHVSKQKMISVILIVLQFNPHFSKIRTPTYTYMTVLLMH